MSRLGFLVFLSRSIFLVACQFCELSLVLIVLLLLLNVLLLLLNFPALSLKLGFVPTLVPPRVPAAYREHYDH